MRAATAASELVGECLLWAVNREVACLWLRLHSSLSKHVFPKVKMGLNLGILRSSPILLPPLTEQHLIMTKVDGLMALRDRLEAAVTSADATRTHLLDALLHEAFAPDAKTIAAAE